MREFAQRIFFRLKFHAPACAILAAISLWLYWPLLTSTLLVSHEGFGVYCRVQQYLQEWQCGFFQPMLMADAAGGAGYAFPLFYPPLSQYVAAALSALAGDVGWGTNLAFFLSAFLSALTCYFLAFRIDGRRSIAIAAASIYITATYRFVDIFVRAALAESWAFVFFPIVLLPVLAAEPGRRNLLVGTIGTALLLCSHTIVGLWFLLFAGVAAAIITVGRRDWRVLAVYALSCTLGFGCAAWYLVPMRAAIGNVWASQSSFMWATPVLVDEFRVQWSQLFYTKPDHWSGLAEPGFQTGMSYGLGVGHLVAWLTALGAFVYVVRGQRTIACPALTSLTAAAAAWCLCIVCIIYPGAVLKYLPYQFSYLQYSWRLLAPAAVFSAALFCCGASSALPRRRFATAAALLLSAVVTVSVPGYQRVVKEIPGTHGLKVTRTMTQRKGDKGFTLGEYFPRSLRDFDHLKMGSPSGDGAELLGYSRQLSGAYTMQVRSNSTTGTVTLALTAYPFWQATANNQQLETDQAAGMVRVHIPSGNTNVSVERHYTFPYYLGWVVTCLSALITLVLRRKID